MTDGASVTAKDKPANSGQDYGATTAGSAGDTTLILDVGTDTSTIAIRAMHDNAGFVYVGFDDSVDDTNGFFLQAGDAVTLDIDNSNQPVYAHFGTSGDQVRYLAVN